MMRMRINMEKLIVKVTENCRRYLEMGFTKEEAKGFVTQNVVDELGRLINET